MKKFLSALAALAMGVGLAVAAPLAASAHTANITGQAVCQADGTWKVIWTVQTGSVPSNTYGEAKVIKDTPTPSLINGQQGQVWLYEWPEHKANNGLEPLQPNSSFTFEQTAIPGNAGNVSVMVQIDWKDGFSHDPEGKLKLQGSCTPPPPTVDVCPNIEGAQAEVPEGYILQEGECVLPTPEPEPEPQVCTLDGDWFSESDDAAPLATIDGLRFTGGTGKASGIGHAINGDFSTFSGASIAATGDTNFLYYRLVIDSTADGGWDYQSLTVTSGLEVTTASAAYSNKVGATKTIAEWQALYPNAQMTWEFVHYDSAATADDSAVVTSFNSECGTNAWGTPQPEALAGTEETVGDPICTEDGIATISTWGRDWTQGYLPKEDRTAWVLGEKVFGEYYLISSEDIEAENCAEEEVPPTEEPPTETPAPTTPTPTKTSLAYTGTDSATGLFAGAAALMLGLAALTLSKLRRRTQ